jgi:glycosyltransferase involved in cell wall biosynthesis
MEKIICAVINSSPSLQHHTIVSLDGSQNAKLWISNIKAEVIPFRKPKTRRQFFLRLFNTLRSFQPDLLMTYNWGAIDAIWLGRLAGVRHIVHHEHGFNVDESSSTVWRRDFIRFIVYRLSTKIVVVSRELERMVQKRFRISKSRIVRIPNGIDAGFYSPNEDERGQMRRSLGYADSEFVIGFSGRLDPVKNVDLMIDIFRGGDLHKKGFRLLIVGDGPEKPRLIARCKAEGIDSYATFVGQQSEVLPYLRAMDVFLLTSSREQMPLTVLEAMSAGVPVIASRVGELPFIIDEGVNGFIRDLGDPLERFLEPLRIISATSVQKELARAARKKITEYFRIETMLERYSYIARLYLIVNAVIL